MLSEFLTVWFGKWFDICECTTLPEYMLGNVNSLHNDGNCIRLYSREGCLGESVNVQGGTSADSRKLETIGFKGLTRSFSVCGDSTMCSRFDRVTDNFGPYLDGSY